MARLFWVCVGGALGTGTRYLVSLWASHALGAGFPYATLIVNLAGSFLLALLVGVGLSSDLMSPTFRLAATTGFMGGLTTYSTFNYETLTLLRERSWAMGLLNATVTFFGCLACGLLGILLARKLAG